MTSTKCTSSCFTSGKLVAERTGTTKTSVARSPRIYYVTKGYAQIELPDKKQDLHPGLMYIIPAFTTHSYICHGEFCHYYIHIYNESDHDILEDWELPTEIRTENETLSYIRKLYKLCPGLELTQTTRNIMTTVRHLPATS